MAKLTYSLVVLAAVATLVAAEPEPDHHYGKPYYYKRPYYYNQRRQQGVASHNLHAAAGGHNLHHAGGHDVHHAGATVGIGSSAHFGGGHDAHDASDLYPGLKEGYSFYDYKPDAGHDGCSKWCYSSGTEHYYCCYELHH